MKSILRYKADKEFEIENESGNVTPIDMYNPEEKKAQSPMELVLGSVAACAAVDIVSMIKKRRKTLVDLQSEATAERAEGHPRKFTKMHIQYKIVSPDLTEKEAKRIVDLAIGSYCSVSSSLSADIVITHGFDIEAE